MNINDILWLIGGASAGVLLTTVVVAWHWRRWQRQYTEQLEASTQIQQLELQIALDELAEKNRLLEQQSMLDTLSGIFNRACFDKRLQNELNRSRREKTCLGLVLVDIDHFKKINDTHGHLAGDAAIQQIASELSAGLKRSSDAVFRYGGEEFAMLLPGTSLAGCIELAEDIRQKIGSTPLQIGSLSLTVTLSAGCYAAVADAHSCSNDYIAAADSALYQAKYLGRNRTASANAIVTPISKGSLNEN
ncbi:MULTISPECIES: GGDEF domain-containing protein [unclassified Arsukibacterium]|uniref:GGDEF domain-containing protein n=1 Tax=unclassified Arsukibacterium TaxID=2635278 RepID=UPI0025C52437|nr:MULTISPECIES: GGDEF domain-containing protein [unclassified Arsukibacterium]|tara:strand:- start:463 stop:1203 length:741 start_codon:yes stop_codon:yes gene_type:complete